MEGAMCNENTGDEICLNALLSQFNVRRKVMKRFSLLLSVLIQASVLGGVGCSAHGSTVSAQSTTSGQYVTIRANALTKIVRVDSSGNLIADQTCYDGHQNELFYETSNSDGTVSFYSVSAQKYVSANSTTAHVTANASSIGNAQKFKINSSTYSSWSDPGTDEVIYSTSIGTDWNIASDTDGTIYSQYANDSGGWENMSVMPVTTTTHTVAAGADISEAKGAQDGGVAFYDTDGKSKDYLTIFQNHDYKWVRCRIEVSPDGNYGLLQTTNYVKSVFVAAKAKNFKLLLDFFFSSTWADPSEQTTPSGWSTTDLSSLKTSLQSYVSTVMTTLSDAGAWPDMVQIGNEVDAGMLWPLGDPYSGGSWTNYATLHNAVYDTINSVKGSNSMPKVMIHLSEGGALGTIRWWLDQAKTYGFKYDVVGLSFYPMWQGNISSMKATIDEINYRFPSAEIAIAETAYYYEDNLKDYSGLTDYAQTEAGQSQFLSDLKTMFSMTKNLNYIFYWGACWSQPSKWYLPSVDTGTLDVSYRALFNSSGSALKGIDSLP
jgi:arabinogalactan endo-1,4-beta-galactosidase